MKQSEHFLIGKPFSRLFFKLDKQKPDLVGALKHVIPIILKSYESLPPSQKMLTAECCGKTYKLFSGDRYIQALICNNAET